MTIIKRESCGTMQPFYDFQRPIVRDAQGCITREGPWTFNPTTGRCIGDTSDRGDCGQLYAHMCFGCHRRYGWVYSSEPPPVSNWRPTNAQLTAHEVSAVDQGLEAEPEYVWSRRRWAMSEPIHATPLGRSRRKTVQLHPQMPSGVHSFFLWMRVPRDRVLGPLRLPGKLQEWLEALNIKTRTVKPPAAANR
ncbi:hypothetical protein DFH07DRAFT_767795 [Mycena maculata]|uniref:Uncharacterized protein n=1 Tax=Mycena maculata TaxID=230809 RepID=A0AAD7NSL1_9AGAR|nr:hypothetical protein DFH07DRAFT_767795 [Mycena maculata]